MFDVWEENFMKKEGKRSATRLLQAQQERTPLKKSHWRTHQQSRSSCHGYRLQIWGSSFFVCFLFPPLTPPHQGVTENYLGYSPCFLRGSLLLLSVDFQVIYFNSQMIISARFDNKWGKNGFLIVSMNPHYSWLWGEKAPEWIISSHTPDSLSLLSLSCALGKLQWTSLLSSPSVAGLIRLHVN